MSVDKKISQLASGAPAQAGDEYVVARSGANYKLTLTNIAGNMPATTISSGNLTFSSTGQRITGDMSNATATSRLAFQSSTTNGNTIIQAIPNGTATQTNLLLYANTDLSNSAALNIFQNATESTIRGIALGTGAYTPLTFYTGGSERMRIDSSTGNVGIGTASPGTRLTISSATNAGISVTDGTVTTIMYNSTGGVASIGTTSNHGVNLLTNNATRVTFDSSGNVGIGGPASANTKVHALSTLPTSSNQTFTFLTTGTIPSSNTGVAVGFYSNQTTAAASFTLANTYHFYANPGSKGAGSSITNQIGFYADSSLTDATNNFGFYSNIASGSNRWNFYAAGTAQNYFAGNTGIGASPSFKFEVQQGSSGGSPSLRQTPQVVLKGYGGSSTYHSGIGFSMFEHTNGYWGSGILEVDDSGSYGAAMAFYTSTGSATPTPSERMRISSSGNVLIATTTQVQSARLTINQSAGGWEYGIAFQDNSSNQGFIGVGGGPGLYFRAGAGNPTGTLNSSGNFIDASDAAYKTDINPISYGLDTVLSLLPKSYKLIANDKPGIGFIAQEMEKIIPEIVSGEEGSKGISYGQLTAVLVKAIQELSAKVAALEAK